MSITEVDTTARGYYFDDLAEGQRFTSAARTITETDVVNFAGLSGDFNPIHLDRELAASGAYGQRVAHGVLGISVVTGFIDAMGIFREAMVAMLSIDNWKFTAPVFIGDTVHIVLTIDGLRRTSSGLTGIVTRGIQLIKQDGTVCQEGKITVMVRTRASLEA